MNSKTLVMILCAGFLGLLLLGGCGQDYNSNSGDEIYGKSGEPTGADLFKQAYGILKNRCMSCHTNAHSVWRNFLTEDKWKQAGLVVPGKKESSEIITKLINEGGDMPKGGKALPSDEHATLLQWVEEMQ